MRPRTKKEIVFEGESLSAGIVISPVIYFSQRDENVAEVTLKKEEVEREIWRFRNALNRSRIEIKKLQKTFVKLELTQVCEILNTHFELLHDPLLTEEVEKRIHQDKKNAEAVLKIVIDAYQQSFKDINDAFFEERMKDILDIASRISGHLKNTSHFSIKKFLSNSVMITSELIPSDIVEADKKRISAFITQHGCNSSHAAIIARAKNIPYIANIDIAALKEQYICQIVVDGNLGKVIINPQKSTLRYYQNLKIKIENYYARLEDKIKKASANRNNKVRIFANIGSESDVAPLLHYQADGVGLFRTEYLFLSSNFLPDEEKQFLIYKNIAQKLNKKPLIIRLFDFGADKNYFFVSEEKYSSLYQENNPLLGCRGVRFLLKHQEILYAQIKAILRASSYGNIHLLIPLVTDIEEIIEIKNVIKKAKEELKNGNIETKPIEIGCMIEVPSAAVMADVLIDEVDFISVGTNDLSQYTLAADSSNANVKNFLTVFHPAIIRMLCFIVKSAKRKKKPLFLCGEVAADIRYLKIFLALGITNFSMISRQIPITRYMAGQQNFNELKKLFKILKNVKSKQQLEQFFLEKGQGMPFQGRFLKEAFNSTLAKATKLS